MENRDLLYFCSFCRDKNDEELSRIGCNIEHTVKNYSRGDIIVMQGKLINHLYILSRGKVKTEMVSNSGVVLPMEEIKAPYPLAAAFLFAKENRFPVDIIALDEVEILMITREAVEKQMAACPGFLRGFMAFSADRMQFITSRLKLLVQKGIKGKIAYHILLREKGGVFDLGKSITSLAESFCVERPSLSRALSEMVRDGIITYKNGKGRILNLNAIKELV